MLKKSPRGAYRTQMQILPDFADVFGAALSRTNVDFGLRRTIPIDRISTYSTCACVKLWASEM